MAMMTFREFRLRWAYVMRDPWDLEYSRELVKEIDRLTFIRRPDLAPKCPPATS